MNIQNKRRLEWHSSSLHIDAGITVITDIPEEWEPGKVMSCSASKMLLEIIETAPGYLYSLGVKVKKYTLIYWGHDLCDKREEDQDKLQKEQVAAVLSPSS